MSQKLASLLLTAGMLALSLCSCTPASHEVTVGRSHRLLEDPTRPHGSGFGARPVAVTLWYPAASGAEETDWSIGPFEFGRTAVDAAWRGTARQPLILLSHGTGGSAAQLSWLAEALVQAGFIALAVNHHGNTAAEPQQYPQGFVSPWERAQDLRFALRFALADPEWGSRIDPDRIGATGFSLGGHTVLLLSGARHSRSLHAAFCAGQPDSPSCSLPPEAGFDSSVLAALESEDENYRASLERAGNDYREPKLRAIFLMAPALVPALDPDSLESLDLPVAMIVGIDDTQAPTRENLDRLPPLPNIEKSPPIPGASHYVFLAPCTLRGRWFAGEVCDDGAGVSRREVHAMTARQATDFFLRHLGEAASN